MDTQALLHELQHPNLPLAGLPEGSIWPRYDGLSVGNLPATVGSLLGVTPPAGTLPPLRAGLLDDLADGVRRVVLVLVDGLGWLRLQALLAEYPQMALRRLSERGHLLPLTSLFPSTTNNVLTALWTGMPPARHGLIAYNLYFREWGMVLEAISFSPYFRSFAGDLDRWGLINEDFIPAPGLGQWLAAGGVPTEVVMGEKMIGSALSRINFRGTRRIYGYMTGSDFWLHLRRALERSRDDRLFLYGYWAAVDTFAHRFGPWDESSVTEVRSLDYLLQEVFLNGLSREARAGTLFLLVADHGQIHTPFEHIFILEQHPALRDALLLPPVGEARVPFLYVRAGKARFVREYLQEHGADRFALYARSEVLRSGLLGPEPYHAELGFRLGDWIGFARGQHALVATENDARRLSGRHGGLSAEEMLIPLLAVRLD